MLYHKTFTHEFSDKWVVFIHGAGGSSSIWYKQLRAFKAHFNILLLDLRGHGRSKSGMKKLLRKYTFQAITDDVIEVLDHLHISKAHFVGVSLGTIVIREMADRYPERIESMIMAGAIMKLNLRSQFLMRMGVILKRIIPYMLIYRFFAWVIMPRKRHRKSRSLFIGEAKKLYQREFMRWYKLTAHINPLLRLFRNREVNIPTLYIMGEEDHMFLPAIQVLSERQASAQLSVIPNSGHVVNVDQPGLFNTTTIKFIQQIAS